MDFEYTVQCQCLEYPAAKACVSFYDCGVQTPLSPAPPPPYPRSKKSLNRGYLRDLIGSGYSFGCEFGGSEFTRWRVASFRLPGI